MTAAAAVPTVGPKHRQRLGFLDALRGLAALAVVVQHGGERVSAGFREVTGSAVQLGQLGVLAFFLVSGFVIPLSLERGGLRRFAVTRVARLYPAYWTSLVLVAVAWQAGVLQIPGEFRHGLGPWLVESTMLQSFLGVPQLQGQYWSLAFEVIFYALAALLYALRLHTHTVGLALAALGTAVAAHVLGRVTQTTVPLGLANVASMFVGTVLFRVASGDVPARTGWRVYAAGAVAVQAVLVLRLRGHTDASTGGTLTLGPMVGAWAGAYLVFAAGFALRSRAVPRWLAWTGLISYSVYLLHPLVMSAVGEVGNAAVTMAVWVTLTLAAAAVAHRLVEAPGIRAGRALAQRLAPNRRE